MSLLGLEYERRGGGGRRRRYWRRAGGRAERAEVDRQRRVGPDAHEGFHILGRHVAQRLVVAHLRVDARLNPSAICCWVSAIGGDARQFPRLVLQPRPQ